MNPVDLEARIRELERQINPAAPSEFLDREAKERYLAALATELADVTGLDVHAERRRAEIREEITRAAKVNPDFTIEYDEDGTEHHVPFDTHADHDTQ